VLTIFHKCKLCSRSRTREESFVPLSILSILKWICETYVLSTYHDRDLLYEDAEGFFPSQNMKVEDVHIDHLSKIVS
jgi:hypothetical protein